MKLYHYINVRQLLLIIKSLLLMSTQNVAKIIAFSKYGVNGYNPINILRKTKFSLMGTNWFRWYDETEYMWKKRMGNLSGKKITNKNVIIAGFLSTYENHILHPGKNFPLFESAENVYFVENGSMFMDQMVLHHKLLFPTNPTVYVVDVGIAVPPIPTTSLKTKMQDLKLPLWSRENSRDLISTQDVIDHINGTYLEESIMINTE